MASASILRCAASCPFHSLSGSGPNGIWAVGSFATIVHWDGSRWTAQPSAMKGYFGSVWGLDATHVWAVGIGPDGHEGAIRFWNGTTWTDQDSGCEETLVSIWGTDPDYIWISCLSSCGILGRPHKSTLPPPR